MEKLRTRVLWISGIGVSGLILLKLFAIHSVGDLTPIYGALFFVMYLASLGGPIVQLLFVNCDSAMLFYPFYRQPKAVLSGVFLPKAQDKWNFTDDAATMNTLMEAIKGIRNLRAESNVPMGKKAPVILAPATEELAQTLKDYEDYFHTLAFADKVTLLSASDANRKMPSSPSFRALKSIYSSKT